MTFFQLHNYVASNEIAYALYIGEKIVFNLLPAFAYSY